MPHPKETGVNLSEFIYDEKKDEYKDTEGNVYKFHQYVDSKNPRKR
ncbi:MAG: hypothetical protein U9Q15_03510 [Patescibacteria group bacterium]|nr:hypothetical protein [Patescibacteria group bacterium]